MSAPNIVNITSIIGKSAYNTPSGITAVVLLANPAASGKVIKINQLVASNVNGGSAISATAAINTLATGAGVNYPIVSAVSVPINASLIIIDKTTSLYLEEDRSITITSGTASGISYTVSYEEIS